MECKLQASLLISCEPFHELFSIERQCTPGSQSKDFISLKIEAIYMGCAQKRAPCRTFPFINITVIN